MTTFSSASLDPDVAFNFAYPVDGKISCLFEIIIPDSYNEIKNLMMSFEAHVHKVVVTELRDDTFFAVIWMEKEGKVISLDSRPSDALALALRLDCPIYVDEEVLKSSKISSATSSDRVSTEDLRKWLEGLNDEDLGRYKM